MKTEIQFEDKHIIVCYKPVGIAVQSASFCAEDMVSELKNYIAVQTHCKNPYLGVIHRLDQPVSGVIVFAKTQEAARGLSKQIAGQKMKKTYRAKVFGHLQEETGELRHMLYQDSKNNTSVVVNNGEKPPNGAKMQEARLTYRVLSQQDDDYSEVEIHLLTGRHHQIRVQFATVGCPLLGDLKYGTEESKRKSAKLSVTSVALCAYRLSFEHPITKKKMTFEAPHIYG